MKVYFLGAGASVAAGYPLASKLLRTLEHECSLPLAGVFVNNAWERFQLFKTKVGGAAGPILRSGNPEIVLSLLDLLCAAEVFEEADFWAEPEAKHPFLACDTQEYTEAHQAIRGLVECLGYYFRERHALDMEPSANTEYLKQELAGLAKGDVVVTTNWDSLAERVLLERGLWHPSDGFGFPVRFRSLGIDGTLKESASESGVKVLKLHGSFGWWVKRSSHPDGPRTRIYLRGDGYLQHMPQIFLLRDLEEPFPPEVNDRHCFVYPSFLKSFEPLDMATIWSKAQEALFAATEVQVAGYSLPASDTPVRTLLNCLRGRLGRREVKVVVDEPSSDVEQRWRAFLPDVEVRKRKWE